MIADQSAGPALRNKKLSAPGFVPARSAKRPYQVGDGMIPFETTIHLSHDLFTEKERPLIRVGATVRFHLQVLDRSIRLASEERSRTARNAAVSGAADLVGRLSWARSHHEINVPRARAHVSYLETYGAFFQHCGFTAMGVPGKSDTHPLHGELPNAAYRRRTSSWARTTRARIWVWAGAISTPPRSSTTTSPSHWSSCTPAHRCSRGNEHHESAGREMEFMYLAHINFRPVDNGRLVCTAPCTPERVRVRATFRLKSSYPRLPRVRRGDCTQPSRPHRVEARFAIQPGDRPHDRLRRR